VSKKISGRSSCWVCFAPEALHRDGLVRDSKRKTTSDLLDKRLEGFTVIVIVIRLSCFEQGSPGNLLVR
jgi:hypothetical protein